MATFNLGYQDTNYFRGNVTKYKKFEKNMGEIQNVQQY